MHSLLVYDKRCALILKHELLPLPSVLCEADKTLTLQDLCYLKCNYRQFLKLDINKKLHKL